VPNRGAKIDKFLSLQGISRTFREKLPMTKLSVILALKPLGIPFEEAYTLTKNSTLCQTTRTTQALPETLPAVTEGM
jgi:hypothetical protein